MILEQRRGPQADRFLMRMKDAIIIGTAAIALIKWFYLNPVQTQDRVTRTEQIQIKQQETLEKIASSLEIQTSQFNELKRSFVDFQRSFYSKKPGGWTYEDDRWKWSKDK